jgi:hypothetical protein
MNTNTALKVASSIVLPTPTTTPSIATSRAEIFALFDVSSDAGLRWDNLPDSSRNLFCRAAGLKQQHISLPLNAFNELDRLKLFKAIKSIEESAKHFASLSFKDFN